MLKTYSAPKEIVKPKFNPDQPGQDYDKLELDYESGIVQYAKQHGSSEHAGKEVSFPYADGYARYIVFSMKPCKLIHLDTGDAWHYPYIERLNSKDILRSIAFNTAIK